MPIGFKQVGRRIRPGYPSIDDLPRGKQGDVTRRECGESKGLPTIDRHGLLVPASVTRGTYVFERELPKPSRSKYCPHKEAQKHGAAHR